MHGKTPSPHRLKRMMNGTSFSIMIILKKDSKKDTQTIENNNGKDSSSSINSETICFTSLKSYKSSKFRTLQAFLLENVKQKARSTLLVT